MNGRGVQAHALKGSEDSLAYFLVGAGKYAYFGIGGWSESGSNFDHHWIKQFAFPLGQPLSDGIYTSSDLTWRRSFRSGVKVSFDVKNGRGTITGGPWTNSFAVSEQAVVV